MASRLASRLFMTTATGIRHRVDRLIPGEGGAAARVVARCDDRIHIPADHYTEPGDDCKRCFPAAVTPSDSLGAASTTLNPPPGEHTGDQQ